VYTNKEGTKSGLLESSEASPTKKELHTLINALSTVESNINIKSNIKLVC